MPSYCPIAPRASSETMDVLEQDIVARLDEEGILHLDVLVALMPRYSWNQVFQAVDRLARRGRIILRRRRFDYTVQSRQYAA